MSGASEATEKLKVEALEHYSALRAHVEAVGKAVTVFRSEADLVEAMKAGITLSSALEATAKAAKEIFEDSKTALAACMLETGATTIRTSTHTVSVTKGRPSVDILDRAAVPDDFLKHEPAPDRSKILKALRAGVPLNWAVLREGHPSLQRRPVT